MTEHRKIQLYHTASRLSNIYVDADHDGNEVLAARAHRIKWKIWWRLGGVDDRFKTFEEWYNR